MDDWYMELGNGRKPTMIFIYDPGVFGTLLSISSVGAMVEWRLDGVHFTSFLEEHEYFSLEPSEEESR